MRPPFSAKCSTPLGITARGTKPFTTGKAAEVLCSTPLGITARGTRLQRGAQGLGVLVLNASRHHGEGDPSPSWWAPTSSTCAQRLSASRRGGQSARPLRMGGKDVCSTPLGITARGTPDIRTCTCSPPSAQRLSASRRGGRAPPPPGSSCTRCAQRLSASRRGGPLRGGGPPLVVAVLNASRHHGEGDQATAPPPT